MGRNSALGGWGKVARLRVFVFYFLPGIEGLNHSSHLYSGFAQRSLPRVLGLVVLYSDSSCRTVGHRNCTCSLNSSLFKNCRALWTVSCGQWPMSLHFPFPSSFVCLICPPFNDSMSQSLKHACVLLKLSYAEL